MHFHICAYRHRLLALHIVTSAKKRSKNNRKIITLPPLSFSLAVDSAQCSCPMPLEVCPSAQHHFPRITQGFLPLSRVEDTRICTSASQNPLAGCWKGVCAGLRTPEFAYQLRKTPWLAVRKVSLLGYPHSAALAAA